MSTHDSKYYKNRCRTLLNIWKEYSKEPTFGGFLSLKGTNFVRAILIIYPHELKKIKKENNLEKLDRHKVAALTTIVVYQSDPIKIHESGKNNSYCLTSREFFSIFVGISDLGIPSFLLDERVLASISSQLKNNQCTVLSLSNQYHLLEERYLIKLKEQEIKYK